MSGTRLSIVLVAVLLSAAPVGQATEGGQKAVLVTGASTGIGRNIAEKLAAEGHYVYAGARKSADIHALSAIENIEGIRLDVTIQAEIDAVAEHIRTADRGLHGVVNNAGVVVIGPVAEIDEKELNFLFDVNIYGPYRVTKALAPLLIESGGRVTNISSMAGIATGPAYGAYSMSKHAIEAYTDALAHEMRAVGVRVSAIAPGAYRSNGGASYCRRRQARGYEVTNSLFPELARDIAALCKSDSSQQFPEPDRVADAVLHAQFSPKPKEHYLATSSKAQTEVIMSDLIEDLVEFNREHEFAYSRDELVAMLDQLLSDQ